MWPVYGMKDASLRIMTLVIQARYLNMSRTILSNVIVLVKRAWLKFNFSALSAVTEKMESTSDVSQETRQLGFEMCRDSIGGVWSEIQESAFEIRTLSGGLTNYLYICSLPRHVTVPDNQPREVLLRVYGDIAKTSNFVVQNSVIFALLSEKKLGPKLYGMNPRARIEEFILSKTLQTADLNNPTISRIIASKLAHFHSLDMPLCKEPRFIYDTMDKWMEEVDDSLSRNKSAGDQHWVKRFRNYNLGQELKALKQILRAVSSPVVFSHNDLQEGNILLSESGKITENSLTFIDWEYCSYNLRGFDLGNHFMEWCFDYTYNKAPFFKYTQESYPSREQQFEFFRAYIQATGEQPTEKHLADMYVEANTFALASHFFWSLWSILQNDMSHIEFGFLEYADCRLMEYFKLKERLPQLQYEAEQNCNLAQ